MRPFKIIVAPAAKVQLSAITRWWREHRQMNPGLFQTEFERTIEQISLFPNASIPYRVSRGRSVYRLRLAGSRYYIYYEVFDESSTARVLAVWHVSRGRTPRI